MTRNADIEIDVDALMAEIARYLAAVEVFRAEGLEPEWLADQLVVDAR